MAATIGDNSKLSPGEQKSLFLHHYFEIAGQREIVKAAKKVETRLRKEARVHGIVLGDIDFALRVNEAEDQNIIVEEMARRNEIARFFNLPVGTQPAFDFAKESSAAKAAREGTAAGYANKPAKPPYDTGTADGQAWLKAHAEARAAMNADLASALAKVTAINGNGAADDGTNDASYSDGKEE